MQDRQDRPVADRVEELGGVPGGGQWSGLGLAITDHARHDQVRVVESRAERVAQGIAELAALVDRAWRRRGDMAGDPTRERELGEQLLQAGLVLADIGIDLT